MMKTFRCLRSLELRNCKHLTDVSCLGGLSLLALSLSGCLNLTDISGLENLVKLKSLKLFQCNMLTNISSISGLSQLKNYLGTRTRFPSLYTIHDTSNTVKYHRHHGIIGM